MSGFEQVKTRKVTLYVYVCVPVGACLRRSEVNLRWYSSDSICLGVLRQGLSLAWSVTRRVGWLSGIPRDLLGSASSVLKLQASTTTPPPFKKDTFSMTIRIGSLSLFLSSL